MMAENEEHRARIAELKTESAAGDGDLPAAPRAGTVEAAGAERWQRWRRRLCDKLRRSVFMLHLSDN